MEVNERTYTFANFFGSYILNTRTVPGYHEINDGREHFTVKELFEIIDDYIEEA